MRVPGHYRQGRWVRPHHRRGAAAAGSGLGVLVVIGAGMTLSQPHSQEPRSSTGTTASVVHVLDGDTLDVTINGREERVRLLGIDTPETQHDGQPAQCYAKQATAMLQQLTPVGTNVVLTHDPSQPRRDEYGRLLRYITGQDADVGLELVTQGAARLYSNVDELIQGGSYMRAAEKAKERDAGLWGDCS